jgi:hypothetical protein
MADVDPYTIKHLDAWLEKEINGDAKRAAVREAMLAFIADDPEYWGSQAWWLVFDRAQCNLIVHRFDETGSSR